MWLESIQLCEAVHKDKIPMCCIISDPSLARLYGCCEGGETGGVGYEMRSKAMSKEQE